MMWRLRGFRNRLRDHVRKRDIIAAIQAAALVNDFGLGFTLAYCYGIRTCVCCAARRPTRTVYLAQAWKSVLPGTVVWVPSCQICWDVTSTRGDWGREQISWRDVLRDQLFMRQLADVTRLLSQVPR
jgi:hypothetical protein